jgi:hypothetical protein
MPSRHSLHVVAAGPHLIGRIPIVSICNGVRQAITFITVGRMHSDHSGSCMPYGCAPCCQTQLAGRGQTADPGTSHYSLKWSVSVQEWVLPQQTTPQLEAAKPQAAAARHSTSSSRGTQHHFLVVAAKRTSKELRQLIMVLGRPGIEAPSDQMMRRVRPCRSLSHQTNEFKPLASTPCPLAATGGGALSSAPVYGQ